MPKISERTTRFTDSVIRRMTRISDEYNAINLSQGFPDFDPPKAITDELEKVAKEIMLLAEKEGLTAHKNSVKVRVNND